ncbi:unnamed protein product [Protopolystoma xenopodis]|uniref:Uncharacterized protein n=1 Tax=Protopolystoma xenopodis TaxID=117903 RepID=A0A3S4ZVP2_9PLAT|nr:unnamed protein product [Protopolystoma xenopodis]
MCNMTVLLSQPKITYLPSPACPISYFGSPPPLVSPISSSDKDVRLGMPSNGHLLRPACTMPTDQQDISLPPKGVANVFLELFPLHICLLSSRAHVGDLLSLARSRREPMHLGPPSLPISLARAPRASIDLQTYSRFEEPSFLGRPQQHPSNRPCQSHNKILDFQINQQSAHHLVPGQQNCLPSEKKVVYSHYKVMPDPDSDTLKLRQPALRPSLETFDLSVNVPAGPGIDQATKDFCKF